MFKEVKLTLKEIESIHQGVTILLSSETIKGEKTEKNLLPRKLGYKLGTWLDKIEPQYKKFEKRKTLSIAGIDSDLADQEFGTKSEKAIKRAALIAAAVEEIEEVEEEVKVIEEKIKLTELKDFDFPSAVFAYLEQYIEE